MTNKEEALPFTVVLPVHNEAKVLRATLPTIFRTNPAEVVVIFDRCTDNSEGETRRVWKQGFEHIKLQTITNKEKSNWSYNLSYLYDQGIRAATNDVVLLCQADILYDVKKISNNMHLANDHIVSFGVAAHPHYAKWNWAVTRFLRSIVEGYSGTVAFSKALYQDVHLVPEAIQNFDTHISIQRKRKRLPYIFIDTKSLHIRPNFRFTLKFNRRLYNLGINKYNANKSFFKVLLWSVIRLSPHTMAGWMHAWLEKK